MLPPRRMARIYDLQRQKHTAFRGVPQTGKVIEYLGKEFVVYPTVFWPSQDSTTMVQNYHIHPGEDVLDVCTGSGVIAIFSALQGAQKVVALDINPLAIKAVKENAKRHGVERIVQGRVSDVFDALKKGETFDVITMNPPFTVHDVADHAERTTWDPNFNLHNRFFSHVHEYLRPNGRAYVCQAKFGAVEAMQHMAKSVGFNVKQIGEAQSDEDRVFYAFELTKG